MGRGIEPATLTTHFAQMSEAQQQRWLDACTVASMLLLVKQYLLSAYSLSAERVRQFHPSDSEKRKSEEKQPVVVNQKAQLHLQTLPLDCALSRDGLQAQGQVGAAAGDKAPLFGARKVVEPHMIHPHKSAPSIMVSQLPHQLQGDQRSMKPTLHAACSISSQGRQ